MTLTTGFATGGARIRNGLARAKDATINAANLPRLTVQQLAFVQALVNGADSYTAAYLKAYPVSKKWPRHAVWAASSRLASHVKVKAWLDVAWAAQTKAVDRSINGHLKRIETVQTRALQRIETTGVGEDVPYLKAALEAEKVHAQALGHTKEDTKADVTVNLVSFADQQVSIEAQGRTVQVARTEGNDIKDITPMDTGVSLPACDMDRLDFP